MATRAERAAARCALDLSMGHITNGGGRLSLCKGRSSAGSLALFRSLHPTSWDAVYSLSCFSLPFIDIRG